MKFTLSWLKAPLDTDADAQTIADKLTSIVSAPPGPSDSNI